LQTWFDLGAIGAVLLLGVGLAALWAIGAWPSLLKGSAYAASAVGGAVGVSGFEFWQTWMLGVVVFAWSAMLLALRSPGLASLPADQTDSTARAAGKAPLRATIA
jgi:hypothetical protein